MHHLKSVSHKQLDKNHESFNQNRLNMILNHINLYYQTLCITVYVSAINYIKQTWIFTTSVMPLTLVNLKNDCICFREFLIFFKYSKCNLLLWWGYFLRTSSQSCLVILCWINKHQLSWHCYCCCLFLNNWLVKIRYFLWIHKIDSHLILIQYFKGYWIL